MNVISIEIKNKIAKTTGDVQYVCGNSDYLIRFSFDAEWDQYETKTARIVNGDGEYHDVVFTGCECDMPIISNAYAIKVGVFAGNLHTTTPAYVPAVKSILCDAGTPADPPKDVYAQIMEMLNAGGGEVTDEQIEQAVSKYLADHPVQETDPTIPDWAKNPEKPTYTAEEVGALPADTVIPAPYELPIASADTLGGVKVGAGLEVAEDGTVGVKPEGKFELIESIQPEAGVMAVERTDLALSEAWVEVITSDSENSKTVGKYVYTNASINPVVYKQDTHQATTNNERMSGVGAFVHNGLWIPIGRETSAKGAVGSLRSDWRERSYLVQPGEIVNRIRVIVTEATGLSNTTINIYGVRANA